MQSFDHFWTANGTLPEKCKFWRKNNKKPQKNIEKTRLYCGGAFLLFFGFIFWRLPKGYKIRCSKCLQIMMKFEQLFQNSWFSSLWSEKINFCRFWALFEIFLMNNVSISRHSDRFLCLDEKHHIFQFFDRIYRAFIIFNVFLM